MTNRTKILLITWKTGLLHVRQIHVSFLENPATRRTRQNCTYTPQVPSLVSVMSINFIQFDGVTFFGDDQIDVLIINTVSV